MRSRPTVAELKAFTATLIAKGDFDAKLAAVAAPRARRARRGCTPESAVLQQIRSGLRVLGVPHWRIGVGSFMVATRYVRMGDPGLPDLVALPRGAGPIFIEVKSARGRLSQEQVAFRNAAQAAGAVHVVARSIDDVLPWVRGTARVGG